MAWGRSLAVGVLKVGVSMLSMIAPLAWGARRSHASPQTCHTPRARRDDVLQLEPASPRYCAPIDLTADVSAGQRPVRVCKLPGRAFACWRCGCVLDGRVTAVPVMTWDCLVTLLNKECKEAACRKSPQASTARQVSIAAARKRRCVDADVR